MRFKSIRVTRRQAGQYNVHGIVERSTPSLAGNSALGPRYVNVVEAFDLPFGLYRSSVDPSQWVLRPRSSQAYAALRLAEDALPRFISKTDALAHLRELEVAL